MTGSNLKFSDPTTPPAIENNFGFISLTVTLSGGFDEFSLLGCLTAGGGCDMGNQLDANFKIPALMLYSQNVPAIGLDQPHPLDLLEDDGSTDIQGTITTYSYNGSVSTVPEPSLVGLLSCFLAVLVVANRVRIKKNT